MIDANEKDWCQAGGDPDGGCSLPADREIMGVPFCGAHAREQEACFVIGDLAQASGIVSDWEKQARCRDNEPLREILGMVRLELDGRMMRQRQRVRACGVGS